MAFEVGAVTLWAGLIVDGDPEEREVAEVVADAAFHRQFLKSFVALGAAAHAPVGKFVAALLAVDERFADAFTEHGAAMIAAIFVRTTEVAAVGAESVPKARRTPLGNSMSPDTGQPKVVAARVVFVGVEKEVDTATRPVHVPITVGEATVATNPGLEGFHQFVESVHVLSPTHR